jgi:hypothetical protein
MYDPLIARMMAPDNYIQAGGFTQSYNRYSYVWNNPLKFTDPSGEIIPFIVLAAVYAAGVGAAQGDIIANQHGATGWGKVGYIAGGAAIGAASGLIGGWAGGVVGTTPGFLGAVIPGAIGGAIGGAAAGAGMAALGGGNVGKSALLGAGFGALGGGLLAGLEGGFNAMAHNGNFWNGNGTTFDMVAPAPQDNKITVGKDMEYSNSYAQKFSDDNFGKIHGLNKLNADGSKPARYSSKGDHVINPQGDAVSGVTTYAGHGKWDVTLFKAAFISKNYLYLTMGHEYLHVSFNSSGLMNNNAQEASISQWENSQLWNFNSHLEYQQYYNPLYDYTKFNFPDRYITVR